MNSLKKYWRVLKPFKGLLFGSVVCVVIAAALTAIAPWIEGLVTTQLTADVIAMRAGTQTGISGDVIGNLLVLLFIIYTVNGAVRMVMQYVSTKAIQDAIARLRYDVKEKMTRLPIQYFDTHQAGDLMSRMTTDMDTVSGALQQAFLQIVMAIFALVLAVIFMISINLKMALIALTILPLVSLMSNLIVKKSQKLFNQQQDALGDLNAEVQEKFTGFAELKLYNYQQAAIEKFEMVNGSLCESGFKANFISGLMTPTVTLITFVTIAILARMGVENIIAATMTVGALQSFVRYVWQVNQPLTQITQLAPTMQASFSALDRIIEYLDEPEMEPETTMQQPSVLNGAVRFENVSFGYQETMIIKDVSVDIKPGEMVAIVGPTGAGKTTIINLLMRFYDVNAGRILLDGHDIRTLSKDAYRENFGMVLQDTWLFSGSVKDNIRYGNQEASDEDVVKAAKQANIHHFIKTLSNGYDFELNEEASNVSNGEKQLLTIARALLLNPSILILDEATSSIDTRLDALIQEALATLMQGRTSFVIAHRLSTIKNADKILVMKDGNIIEIGNHESLMADQGFYADLYNSQFSQ